MSKPVKRTYTSTRRRQQADLTRHSILDAARKLFLARGYDSATIEAIAQEAGVAPETIYAVFGNKLAILKRVFETTLLGDEDPVPLLERPFVKETIRETDPRRRIAMFAQQMYDIMQRMSPLFSLLRATAKTDPQISAMFERILKDRLGGMSFFVNHLAQITPLREQVSPDSAAATTWALSSAEVFQLLTHNLGWSEEQYVAWLRDSLERLLLP